MRDGRSSRYRGSANGRREMGQPSLRLILVVAILHCWGAAGCEGIGGPNVIGRALEESMRPSERSPSASGESGAVGLGRTMSKLKSGEKVAVGYIGGSITKGGGASDEEKTSWRALTTAWFREQFPEAAIGEVNAAVSGTGSDLAAFRCQRDLLSGNPNLVFVEFAVNDAALPEDRCLRGMEGVVRQIWGANPSADIVFVYTTARGHARAYDHGEAPETVARHERVAEHYGIPAVNVGKALWQRIRDGGGKWEELLPDGAHPSDEGYAIYAEAILRFLSEQIEAEAAAPRAALPPPFTDDPLEDTRLVDAWEIETPGWTRQDESMAGHYPHMLSSNTPGASLAFRFSGTFIGLYWLVTADSGDIEWSVDGSEYERAPCWDEGALQWTRASYIVLRDDLESGEHELRIRVLAEKQARSTGNWIRIAAMLVH